MNGRDPSTAGTPIPTPGGRVAASLLALVLMAGGAVAAPSTGSEIGVLGSREGAIPLHFTGSPAMAPVAAELAALPESRLRDVLRYVALPDAGGPVEVLLATEDSPWGRAAPSWVAGYALGEQGRVVLFPRRSPSYPDAALDDVLVHELTHVLVVRAAGGGAVPRWFHEGVAMAASRSWGVEDRARSAWALLRRRPAALRDIDALFAGDRGQVPRAYALAGALVRHLVREHGSAAPAAILYQMRQGEPFPEAFRRAAGSSLRSFEASFGRRSPLWDGWLPLLGSSATLWLLITALALWAGAVRRRRAAVIAEAWDDEEELEARRVLAAIDEDGRWIH